MSEWSTIDKLGSVGVVSDEPVGIMQPPGFDFAVNVRAIGQNLKNAGGYGLVGGFPVLPNIDPVWLTQFIPFPVSSNVATEGRLTQFIPFPVSLNVVTEGRLTQISVMLIKESSEYV